MLQTILLVVMILISLALAGVILLQRSEGGALGMGGGPSGFMTARGAGNLLTKTTWTLSILFFLCAVGLTIVGNMDRASSSVVDAAAIGDLATPPPAQGAPTDPATAEPAPAEKAAPTLESLESSLTQGGSTPPAQPTPAN